MNWNNTQGPKGSEARDAPSSYSNGRSTHYPPNAFYMTGSTDMIQDPRPEDPPFPSSNPTYSTRRPEDTQLPMIFEEAMPQALASTPARDTGAHPPNDWDRRLHFSSPLMIHRSPDVLYHNPGISIPSLNEAENSEHNDLIRSDEHTRRRENEHRARQRKREAEQKINAILVQRGISINGSANQLNAFVELFQHQEEELARRSAV